MDTDQLPPIGKGTPSYRKQFSNGKNLTLQKLEDLLENLQFFPHFQAGSLGVFVFEDWLPGRSRERSLGFQFVIFRAARCYKTC